VRRVWIHLALLSLTTYVKHVLYHTNKITLLSLSNEHKNTTLS
jgi:hypothetical protein